MQKILDTKNFLRKYRIILVTISIILLIVIQTLVHKGVVEIQPIINILGVTIHIYSIFIVLAAAVIVLFIKYVQKRGQLAHFDIENLLIIDALFGLFFARLWHVITDFHLYTENPIMALYIWNGGLSIFGAAIGVILGTVLYSKVISKMTHDQTFSTLKLMNFVAFILPLAQIIGRYGNLINQELYGRPTDTIFGMFISRDNRPYEYIRDSYFHPAYLYEQIGNAVLLMINFYLYKKVGFRRHLFIATWLIGYGSIRFAVEFYRIGTSFIGPFTFSQIVSIMMIALGLFILEFSILKKKQILYIVELWKKRLR